MLPCIECRHSEYAFVISLLSQGHYCPEGSALALPCPTGEYQPNPGSDSCIPCRPGFYCEEAIVGEPWPCPPHSFCPAGTVTGKRIKANLFDNCHIKPRMAAQFLSCCKNSHGSAVKEKKKPLAVSLLVHHTVSAFHLFTVGTMVPRPCPNGTYTQSNQGGLREERECLPCPPGKFCRYSGCAAGPCMHKLSDVHLHSEIHTHTHIHAQHINTCRHAHRQTPHLSFNYSHNYQKLGVYHAQQSRFTEQPDLHLNMHEHDVVMSIGGANVRNIISLLVFL